MRIAASCLIVLLLGTSPASAQEQPSSHEGRGRLFWSGLALGLAGATASVLGVTAFRVEDTSTGNAPAGTYQACVAQKSDPIYATNSCDPLKGKNRGLLWGGVAAGALGAVLMIGGTHTSAEISAGAVRVFHTIRF
jgi:hypothetical protein